MADSKGLPNLHKTSEKEENRGLDSCNKDDQELKDPNVIFS